ncbi:unnamed protein product [Rhizophagus irregularis]|uniref:Uncharacterized protein n=1 Tax=Rhizophagus irregularis TaxID=588596 RepID=A0A2I1FV43_9GLOM|nr:hypothetical protein RhiirA4_451215 [Rhizophagus irregularis]CAB4439761.1 unnamed protein product [Rhizophagus irregularis]
MSYCLSSFTRNFYLFSHSSLLLLLILLLLSRDNLFFIILTLFNVIGSKKEIYPLLSKSDITIWQELEYKQNSNDTPTNLNNSLPVYYNLEDKVDEDSRNIDKDRNVDENRNIDNDCKECCETMKIKFKTILDEIRDLFSTG